MVYLDGREFDSLHRDFRVVADEARLRFQIVAIQLYKGAQGSVQRRIAVRR